METVIVKEGQARVLHRNGNVFFGHAVYDGNAVTFEGRLADREDRPLISRTWPMAELSEVRWQSLPTRDELEEMAA